MGHRLDQSDQAALLISSSKHNREKKREPGRIEDISRVK